MKKLIPIVFTLLIGFSQFVSAQNLAERRAIKSYQESVLPDLQSDINNAAGFEVVLNIDWDKIALPGGADNYESDAYFTDIYFKPLIKAFLSISSDELGKEALVSKLKSVKITYDSDTAPTANYGNGIAFEGDQLTINFRPFSNAGDIDERAEAMIEELESKL